MLLGSHSIRFPQKPELPPSPTKFHACVTQSLRDRGHARVASQSQSQVECVHSSEVLLEVMLEQERAAALGAHEGPQPRVDERVLAHVAAATERLAARAARVRGVGCRLLTLGLDATWKGRPDGQLQRQACKERKPQR